MLNFKKWIRKKDNTRVAKISISFNLSLDEIAENLAVHNSWKYPFTSRAKVEDDLRTNLYFHGIEAGTEISYDSEVSLGDDDNCIWLTHKEAIEKVLENLRELFPEAEA